MALSFVDLRLRVFLLLVEPVVKVSHSMNLSLDDVEACVQAVYVRLLRERGLSLEQIARKSGRSRRNISSLMQMANNVHEPLKESDRIAMERAVVLWLSTRSSGTKSEILEDIPSKQRPEATRAIERLLSSGVLEEHKRKLSLSESLIRLEGESEEKRLDSLRHFLEAVSETVQARFLKRPADAHAFARVISFRAHKGRLLELQEKAYRMLTEAATELDELAEADAANSVHAHMVFATSRDSQSRDENADFRPPKLPTA